MLQKDELENYKSKLELERKRIQTELTTEEKPVDFGGDVDHQDEEADEAEEFDNKLAVTQALKDQLNEIDMALNRMKLGTYGICTKCGKEIEKEVLDLVPESELCETDKKASI